MVVPSVRDAHLLRMNNSLPRGYLSGPRPLSDAIPGAPASAVFPAIIIVSENQRPPLHMGWRGHLLRSLASPSLQSPRDQPRGPGSPLADRAPPRRLRRRPVRLPRLRIRQELPEGPYLERPRDAEAPQGERAARRHPAPAAQHTGRRVLGRPGRGVELPPDAALRRRRDDDDGAIHPPHDAGEPAARDDGEDLPGVRHRHPGRPDRQGNYSYLEAKDLHHMVLSSMLDPDFDSTSFTKRLVTMLRQEQIPLFDLINNIVRGFNVLWNNSPHGHDYFYQMEIMDERVA